MTTELLKDLPSAVSAYGAFAQQRNKILRERLSKRVGGQALAEALFEELDHGGKFLRPTLTLASHAVFSGGKTPSPECLAAAHALEVFHAFVLVHDDVIDQSDQRRGRPTLHRRLEHKLQVSTETAKHLAIVLGDILFGYAIGLLSEPGLDQSLVAPLQQYLAGVTEDTGLGEGLELTYLNQPLSDVTVDQIEEVYYLKTTRYTIEAPLWLGARAAGMNAAGLEPLTAFARPIGLGFQLENDLHETALPRHKFGQLTYDFQTGVKTLFLRRLYDDLSGEKREILNELPSRCGESTAALNQLYDLVHSTDTLDTLLDEAEQCFQDAREWIPSSPYPTETQSGLSGIADLVFARRKHSEAREE